MIASERERRTTPCKLHVTPGDHVKHHDIFQPNAKKQQQHCISHHITAQYSTAQRSTAQQQHSNSAAAITQHGTVQPSKRKINNISNSNGNSNSTGPTDRPSRAHQLHSHIAYAIGKAEDRWGPLDAPIELLGIVLLLIVPTLPDYLLLRV